MMVHERRHEPASKDQIRHVLAEAQQAFEQVVAEIETADLVRSFGPGERSIREIIAHISRGEMVHVRLAQFALRGLHPRLPRRLAPHVIRAFNSLEQALLRREPYPQLLDRQRHGRQALLAFIDQCSEQDLQCRCFQLHELTWAPLSTFLIHIGEHQLHHVDEIRRALGEAETMQPTVSQPQVSQ